MASNTPLPLPPYNASFTDRNGLMTQTWALWFQQLYTRVGGTTPIDPTIKTQTLISANAYNFTTVPASSPPINWPPGSSIYVNPGQVLAFFQSGVGVTTIIDSFTAQNNSASQVLLNVWIVSTPGGTPTPIPSSGTTIPAGSNQQILNQAIQPGAKVSVPGLATQILNSSAYIAVQASAPGVLLCTLTGRQNI